MNKIDCAKKSILAGVRKYLDHRTFDLEAAIQQIKKNWSEVGSRSKQNWRLTPVPLKKDSNYMNKPDSEVFLERNILQQCGGFLRLSNQMPTASGLLPLPEKGSDGKRRNVPSEGRRAIDLVFRPNAAQAIFEFIELKVRRNDGTADSPSDAGLELLEYGLLYLFSRKNRIDLEYTTSTKGNTYEVLDATEIKLRVLARKNYYDGQEDDLLPVAIVNSKLNAFIEADPDRFGSLTMNFDYEEFADNQDICSAFSGKTRYTVGGSSGE